MKDKVHVRRGFIIGLNLFSLVVLAAAIDYSGGQTRIG